VTGKGRRAPRFPQQEDPWVPVLVKDLFNPEEREYYPPKTRLWLYLKFKSREGQRPVRLANAVVAEMGLCRQQKQTCLRHLEERGKIAVERDGRRTPIITFIRAGEGGGLSCGQ
jgi:hypothetical protein